MKLIPSQKNQSAGGARHGGMQSGIQTTWTVLWKRTCRVGLFRVKGKVTLIVRSSAAGAFPKL